MLTYPACPMWRAQGIARTALHKNTGARGLRSILESSLMKAMYEVPDDLEVTAVHMDEDPETKALV